MEETMEGLDEEDLEEEADAEVDKVLFELTDGKLGQAGKVGGELPVSGGGAGLTTGPGRGRGGERGRDAAHAEGDAGSPQWIDGCYMYYQWGLSGA